MVSVEEITLPLPNDDPVTEDYTNVQFHEHNNSSSTSIIQDSPLRPNSEQKRHDSVGTNFEDLQTVATHMRQVSRDQITMPDMFNLELLGIGDLIDIIR
jgi:hypothetical protein